MTNPITKKQTYRLMDEAIAAARKQGIVFKRNLFSGKTKLAHVGCETPVRQKDEGSFSSSLEHTGEEIWELRFEDGLNVRFSFRGQ